MPQSLTFQDEDQEFRATLVPSGPFLLVTDDRIRRFVNTALALSAVAPTESVDFNGLTLTVLLDDGRTADYTVTEFNTTNPVYVVATADEWSAAEQENVAEVLRAVITIHNDFPISEMRWEKL